MVTCGIDMKKAKKKRKRRKRIKKKYVGNDRALMKLCIDLRKRWRQYGENRLPHMKMCVACERKKSDHCHHIVPLGPRPLCWTDFVSYAYHMFNSPCQWLCERCHKGIHGKRGDGK